MLRKIAIGFCLLWTIAIIVGLIVLTPYTKPITKGNLTEFCQAVFGVDPKGVRKGHDGYSPVIIVEDQVIYRRYYFMGDDPFKMIDKKTVETVFPIIRTFLEKQSLEKDPNNYCAAGYLAWESKEYVDDPNNFKTLTDEIYKAYQKWQVRRGHSEPSEVYGYYAIADYDEEIALDKMKHFWANYVFEFSFFTGLVWFMCWPLIKREKFRNFAIRIGLLPLLLFLPYYLGYGISLSCCGFDGGGILYNIITCVFRGNNLCRFDRYILERIPRVLEPLNQRIGLPISNEQWLDYIISWGPIELLGIGVGLTLLLLLLNMFFRRIKRKWQP